MEIVFIGAGRLATQLAQSLAENGHRIMAVYSRTLASAETLAGLVGASATDEIASLPTEADAFIIAVKDGAIATLVAQLAEGRAGQTFLHTAGGSDAATLDLLRTLAASVSRQVTELSSEARRHLHLAAVFASNFTNHCYALAAEVLSRHGLPFSVMLPLIDETAAKVHDMLPADAQTGPAVRYDTQVIEAQSQLLAALPQAREVYDVMSRSIHELSVER